MHAYNILYEVTRKADILIKLSAFLVSFNKSIFIYSIDTFNRKNL